MGMAAAIMNNIVPVSDLTRGKANDIFERIMTGAPAIVVKNNEPTAVMLSPEEYDRLIEDSENLYLLQLATERLADADASRMVSRERALEELCLTQADLDDTPEVEFE